MIIRDSITDGMECSRCGQLKDRSDLDRLLWCDACRVRARFQAAARGRLAGLALAAIVAAYVWGVVRPSDLVLGGWIATVVGAFWIGGRIGREIFYGIERAKETPYQVDRAVEDPSD